MEALGLSEAELWKAELAGISPTFDLHLSLSRFFANVAYQKSLRFFTAVMGALISILTPVFAPSFAQPISSEMAATVATDSNINEGCFNSLQRGSAGSAVQQLQISLVQQGYNTEINGVFDEQTEIAIRLFQRDNLSEIDGIYDAQTCDALAISASNQLLATNSSSPDDDELWPLGLKDEENPLPEMVSDDFHEFRSSDTRQNESLKEESSQQNPSGKTNTEEIVFSQASSPTSLKNNLVSLELKRERDRQSSSQPISLPNFSNQTKGTVKATNTVIKISSDPTSSSGQDVQSINSDQVRIPESRQLEDQPIGSSESLVLEFTVENPDNTSRMTAETVETTAEENPVELPQSEIARIFNTNNLRTQKTVLPTTNQQHNFDAEDREISRVQAGENSQDLGVEKTSPLEQDASSSTIQNINKNQSSSSSKDTLVLEILLENYPRSLVTSKQADLPILNEAENILERKPVEPQQNDLVSSLNDNGRSPSEEAVTFSVNKQRLEDDPSIQEFSVLPDDLQEEPNTEIIAPLEQQEKIEEQIFSLSDEGRRSPSEEPVTSPVSQLLEDQPSNPEFNVLPSDNPEEPGTEIITPLDQQEKIEDQQGIDWSPYLLFSLGATAEKYPYIVNPTDNLTLSPDFFRPNADEEYSTFDFRFAEESPILNSMTYARFPKEKQFYWTLPNNTIVMETEGDSIGLFHEGRSTNIDMTEVVLSEQRFLGLQSVFALPNRNDNLVGTVESGPFSVLTLIAQVENPSGVTNNNISVDTGLNLDGADAINILPILGSGSTNNILGGGALFQNLDPQNAPLFLQAFPTNDLKSLLNDGVSLRPGEIIPIENLERTGIGFNNPFTGEGFKFAAPQTSTPGIKIGQPGGGANFDLLNMVVNPFQSAREREIRYLNSLLWTPLGQREVGRGVTSERTSSDWYRLSFSKPHKKTILSYDPEAIKVTYESIFSNPGISATFSLDDDADGGQFVNATLGLALGGIYENIKIDTIDTSLEEAQLSYKNGDAPAELQTAATPEQRRALNQRLHQNLINSDRVTQLTQVSGDYTFPAEVEEKQSNIIQLRTGLYQRRVEYQESNITSRDPIYFFSDLDVKDFGPLGFIGTLQPVENTSLVSENEAIAGQVVLIGADGRQSYLNFNSQDNTVVPILGGRAFDIAFDEISIAQLTGRELDYNSFLGKLYLPSIELVASGTNNDFNYGLSLGSWFNLFPNEAGSVNSNSLGLEESSIGAYAHGIANFILRDVKVDDEGKPIAISTQVPFLDIGWNSETNRLNTFQVTGGYSFSSQQLNGGFSLTTALTYVPQGSNAIVPENSNGSLLGLVSAQAGFKNGLTGKVNAEIGKTTFIDVEGLARVSGNFSSGLYYQNFNINNIGLDSREAQSSFGAIFRYSTLDSRLFFNARVGKSDDSFDARLSSQMRFNF